MASKASMSDCRAPYGFLLPGTTHPPTQLATKVVKSVTGLVPLKLNYETPVLGQVFSLRSRLGVDLRELSSITSAYGSLWSFIAIYG